MNLNMPGLRVLMAEELDHDLVRNALYISPRLTEVGAKRFPDLLRAAFQNGTPMTLANALRAPGILKAMETRNTKNGTVAAKVPINAHETLAYGEFNRFYCRAVCRFAVATLDEAFVEIYRAMEVTVARTESEAKIGSTAAAGALLEDLRVHIGVDTALGIPAGPNSGLSIRLIK